MLGKTRRLGHLIPPDRAALWLPLDDGLIAGPEDHLRNPRRLLQSGVTNYVTAVLGFRGVLNACHRQLAATPVIVNLTASTTLGDHIRKVPVGRVTDAVRDGADAVACHMNLSSAYEPQQLETLGHLVSQGDSHGVPVVAMAYPRLGRPDGTDHNYLDLRRSDVNEFTALVRHCVRVVVELGASAVKTVYTGTEESFRTVIEAAMGVPVVIAGEQLVDEADAIAKAQAAVRAGAAGVAYGRQIFSRPDPVPFVRKLHESLSNLT